MPRTRRGPRGRASANSSAFFYVDTLEHLRRGGRIGAAGALVGSALAIKPLLRLDDGRIVPLENVRTSSRGIARLEEIAMALPRAGSAGGSGRAPPGRRRAGASVAERLRRSCPSCRRLAVCEVGAVVGAHVGPGMLAVVVAPAP